MEPKSILQLMIFAIVWFIKRVNESNTFDYLSLSEAFLNFLFKYLDTYIASWYHWVVSKKIHFILLLIFFLFDVVCFIL